ncbi:MAG: phosphomannomutase/phosphoglucomutase [Thermoleophilia bacterium]|nr:phosphomannomutase/phosphoglucomutase [Thermoleophilia bacterium]
MPENNAPSWPLELPRSGNDPISFAVDHLDPTLFREYDVRGTLKPDAPTTEEPLNEFVANRLGRAFGTFLDRRGKTDVVVGHDSRSYSEKLATAFTLGLLSTGRNVVFIGLATTPTVYFAQHLLGGFAGVQVTASHNPNGWAGFKLGDEPSITLGPDGIKELHEIAVSRDFATGQGTYSERIIIPEYVEELTERVPKGKRPLKIVVDGGNSISGPVLNQALEAAGYETIPINLELDWTFPNHEPDPESVEARKQIGDAVKEHGADVGLSIDGDGDRLGVTDENGGIVWSDIVLTIFAADSLERHPGGSIVYDVKCSRAVADVVTAKGGVPVMWKTGHSHIKTKARELNAPFSGERSGHFFDAGDYYGFDDAVYTGLRFAQILSKGEKSVAEIVGELPQYVSTPTMHVHSDDAVKYVVVDTVLKQAAELPGPPEIIDVNGVRAEWDDGWFLVRASSNLPALVIVIEANTDERLRELYDTVRSLLDPMDAVAKDWENDPFV